LTINLIYMLVFVPYEQPMFPKSKHVKYIDKQEIKKSSVNGTLFERPNVSPVVSTDWLVGYDQTEEKISKNLRPV
jgi:hypothetical protein